jgi:Sortase domain
VPALAVAGCLLLLAAGVMRSGATAGTPSDAGTVPQAATSLGAARADAGRPAGVAAPGVPAPSPTSPSKVRPAPWPVAAVMVPVAMALPGLAGAPVVPVGVTAGELDLPEVASTLGWWTGGAGLDALAGTIVLAGHVDTAADGLGYLSALRQVPVGSTIDVRGEDGGTRHYRITGRRSYPKDPGLPASIFDQEVQARLAIITCTGSFDATTHSYQDNLVVYALPVS